MPDRLQAILNHQQTLARCRLCRNMQGPPVYGQAVMSPIMLVGQAPGDKEIQVNRPFAWTAGKTLFKWFEGIGLEEDSFRQRIYMSAVCRCFPGKKPKGGDRVPAPAEIRNCQRWLDAELGLVRPELIIPVGKLAINRFLDVKRLDQVVGQTHRLDKRDIIPLPHPSGVSTWHRTEPGKSLLQQALGQISQHPAWLSVTSPDQ